GGLHRVVGGREVRIEAAPGGVEVEPLDAETEPVVRAVLGLAFDLEPFYAWAADNEVLAVLVPRLAGFRPSLSPDPFEMLVVALRGIGEWTAEWFLARHLARPNAWPAGDLALRKAVAPLDVDAARVRFHPFENLSAHYLLLSQRVP